MWIKSRRSGATAWLATQHGNSQVPFKAPERLAPERTEGKEKDGVLTCARRLKRHAVNGGVKSLLVNFLTPTEKMRKFQANQKSPGTRKCNSVIRMPRVLLLSR